MAIGQKSKGKKAVVYKYKLIGGHNEGTFEIKTRRLPPKKISLSSGMFYTQVKNEDVSIIQWEGKKRSSNWISHMFEIYEKDEEKQQEEFKPVYRYIDHYMEERCSAKTQKGKRCMKPALSGKTYCCITHK